MNDSKELQRVFFNLLSTLFNESNWEKHVYKNILTKISEYIEAEYIGIYMHYEKTATFRMLDSVSNNAALQPIRTISDKVLSNKEIFFENQEIHNQVQFIPLQLQTDETLIIVTLRDYPLSEILINQLKKETEKLLTIVQSMRLNMMQNRNNKFLLDVSTKLLKSHDKKIILEVIIESLEKLYPNYQYCLILTQEHDTDTDLPIKIMEYKDESFHLTSTQVFMNGELQIELYQDEGMKAVFAPLTGEQSVYGILEINAPIDRYFSTQELEFISEFAILAGKALEKTILYEDSLMQVNNLTLLNEIIHELNSSAELSEITELVEDKIISLTHASQIGFVYFDEEGNDGFTVLPGSAHFFKGSLGIRLIEKIKAKLNVNSEPIFSGNDPEAVNYGFRSVMVIPMVYSGLSMGFTVILHESKYQFTFEKFKLIESLIQHSALAISNTILKEKLQTTVITDFLTQMYSRKYLEDTINQHIELGETGVLLLFDIDDFKQVNDQFGHHIGDKVLKQVAHIIDLEIGNIGVPARWGGEELAVYIPEITLEEGNRIANRIRATVANVTDPVVTVSCGISSWRRGYQDNSETLFLQADKALYKAKSNGKNRVLSIK